MEQQSAPEKIRSPPYIIHPEGEHTHTIVFLHGRGSTGEEFAGELFESTLSNAKTLQEALPGWRWVFPSSRELWSTVFQESMPAWFEAHSLSDTTSRQDLQVEGIKESVFYVRQIAEEEIERLDGSSENLALGGISQGGAIALWTLLCQRQSALRRLGAFVGLSTWLPFAINIRRILTQQPDSRYEASEFDSFVESMMAPLKKELHHTDAQSPILRTSVFIGHGADDAYVDVELGREVSAVLTSIGLKVDWREYLGAEEEGHWLKAPEEFDDVGAFLACVMPQSI